MFDKQNHVNMKTTVFISFLFVLYSFTSFPLQAKSIAPDRDSINVYIFLHEDCIISQYYTILLKELHKVYGDENIQFIGLFPNFSSKHKKIQAFKEKYNIPFPLKTDYYHTKKEAFGASVTPEVIVYNESQAAILYKGRIDDTYARVGVRRRVTGSSELKNALEAIKNNKAIEVKETIAVGCIINKKKLTIK